MKPSGNLKAVQLAAAAVFVFTVWGTTGAWAVVQYDQDVTPDIIFGSGNLNGSFTTDRRNGIEIGLRGKLRFNALNLPENTFNSNSNGTYNFNPGNVTGFGFDMPPNNTPEWSFEWSVNTDFDGSSGMKLIDFTYEMGLDFDPGPGTNFLIFDNITPSPPEVPFYDHAIGDNTTANGAGTSAGDAAGYLTLLENNNVAQNSWNYEFFDNGSPFSGFDPTVDGNYIIYLLARNLDGDIVARVEIQILVGDAEPVGPPIDHFQCYDVNNATKLDPRPVVSLEDQFGDSENVRVNWRAESYCVPVDKNGEGIINADNALTCYRVYSSRNKRLEVTIDNQFGEQTFKLRRPEQLCVPSRQLSVNEDHPRHPRRGYGRDRD